MLRAQSGDVVPTPDVTFGLESARGLDDLAFRIAAARKSVAAGDVDIAKAHLEVAAGIVNRARVERGLVELKHATVIETRPLEWDLSDARGDK